jgi:hypothetical protein
MDVRFDQSRAEVGRAFGFLVHDVSRLIKRRFERRARQMGLPITRQQAAAILNIAGNEGVGGDPRSYESREPVTGMPSI